MTGENAKLAFCARGDGLRDGLGKQDALGCHDI